MDEAALDAKHFDAKLDELKSSLFFLSDSVAKATSGASKLADIAAALELLAKHSSRNEAEFEDIKARLQSIQSGDTLTDMAKRMEKLADSVAWIARQNNDAFDDLKRVLQKAETLPAKADVQVISEKMGQLASESDVREVSNKLSSLEENLAAAQRSSADLEKELNALNNRLQKISDSFTAGAGTQSDAKLDEISNSFTQRTVALEAAFKQVAVDLGEKTLDADTRVLNKTESISSSLASLAGDMRAATVGLAEQVNALNSRLDALANAVQAPAVPSEALQSIESKVALLAEHQQRALAAIEESNQQRASTAENLSQRLSDASQQTTAAVEKTLGETNTRLENVGSRVSDVQNALVKLAENQEAHQAALASVASQAVGAAEKVQFAVEGSLEKVPQAVQQAVSKEIGRVHQATEELRDSSTQMHDALLKATKEYPEATAAALRSSMVETNSKLEAISKQYNDMAALSANLSSQLASSEETIPKVIKDSLAPVLQENAKTQMEVADVVATAADKIPQHVQSALAPALRSVEEATQKFASENAALRQRIEALSGLETKIDNVERVLSTVRESSESQHKQNQLLSEALSLVNKDVASQAQEFNELARGISGLQNQLAEQQRQNQALLSAITSVVQEMAAMEKDLSQAKDTLKDPTVLYSAMEKRLMTRLSEKLASA